MCTNPDTLPVGSVVDLLEEHSDDEDWVLALEYPLNSEAERTDQEHMGGSEVEAAGNTSLEETDGSGWNYCQGEARQQSMRHLMEEKQRD